MKKGLGVTVLVSLVLSSNFLFAQEKYSNEFLSIGVGARALAMAGAQVATVNDVTSTYWNPAGLVNIKDHLQLALMHNAYFGGIADYNYGGLAVPTNPTTTIGFSLIRLGVDDIPNTLDMVDPNGFVHYDRVKSFSVADYGFFFTYSKNSKLDGFTYGGNAKVIHRIAGEFAKAWGFGFDLGAQYKMSNWSFGITAKDVTSTFNAWSFNTEQFEDVFVMTGNEVPKNSLEVTLPKMILGTAYTTDMTKKFAFTLAADFDVTFDGQRNVVFSSDPVSVDPHAGFELDYNRFLFLRGGVQNIQQIKDFDNTKYTVAQPNLGIGIKLKNLTIDYALTHVGGTSESLGAVYSNVFSLKLDIHKKPK